MPLFPFACQHLTDSVYLWPMGEFLLVELVALEVGTRFHQLHQLCLRLRLVEQSIGNLCTRPTPRQSSILILCSRQPRGGLWRLLGGLVEHCLEQPSGRSRGLERVQVGDVSFLGGHVVLNPRLQVLCYGAMRWMRHFLTLCQLRLRYWAGRVKCFHACCCLAAVGGRRTASTNHDLIIKDIEGLGG